MGNSLSDTYIEVFANRGVWIEDAAIQQLQTTARNLAGMRAAVGLPDLHPGRGYPVGAAFFSVGRFYPALVDRKSTRLNSSHLVISYAVFCLKKKKVSCSVCLIRLQAALISQPSTSPPASNG